MKDWKLIGVSGELAGDTVDYFAHQKFAHYETDWPAKLAILHGFGVSADHFDDPLLVDISISEYGESGRSLVEWFQAVSKDRFGGDIWLKTAQRAFEKLKISPEIENLHGMTLSGGLSGLDYNAMAWAREAGWMLWVNPTARDKDWAVKPGDIVLHIEDGQNIEEALDDVAVNILGLGLDNGADEENSAANG